MQARRYFLAISRAILLKAAASPSGGACDAPYEGHVRKPSAAVNY
jgi:hypothetical protein